MAQILTPLSSKITPVANLRSSIFSRNSISNVSYFKAVAPLKSQKFTFRPSTPVSLLESDDQNVSSKIQVVTESESYNSGIFNLEDILITSSVFLTPLLLDSQSALAVEGEFGILEGRSAALIHPIGMASFFLFTLYAGYLGWQWRRVRTLNDEISVLKKQIPQSAEGVAEVSPLQAQIEALSEERKALIKGGFRDKHFNAGSILLGGGIFLSVGGAINTWSRTGKLFPGPHLFAGAAITVLWALAAALVPAMQKGDDNARSAHIALNAINVLLFVWQIPTGIEIVFKVFQFTTWP